MGFGRKGRANRGSGLEATVIASQGGVVRVVRLPTGCKWAGSKPIPVKGPVDFAGVVCGTGRAIYFDAKECETKSSFSLHPSHVPPHQRQFLWHMGEGSAVAGLLIEAKHPDLKRYFWMNWRGIPLFGGGSVKWADLLDLGDSRMVIKFENIPGVRP